MMDLRPILLVCGLLLMVLGLFMLVPAALDLAYGNPDWKVFLSAALVTLFIGASTFIAYRGGAQSLGLRQAFVMTVLLWVLLPAFGALPFMFSERELTYTDAFFEAMSGLTTTGATVISNLDTLPPGILLWRALLQWLGGIGVVVMAISVLPMLQIGGMQLFRAERYDTAEKILPSAAQIAGAITGLYVLLSVICMAALWAAGMSAFDAVAHAMTSIATGGYSTHDLSIGYYDNASIEAIVTLTMITGSLPFIYMIQLVRGRPGALWRDDQTRFFITLIALIIALVTIWLATVKSFDFGQALRYASFNVVSIVTGTGYASTDYAAWGGFANILFFFIMFIGGCAGSTSCGIKIFRVQVLLALLRRSLKRVFRPHQIYIPSFNDRPITEAVFASVMNFFVLFVFVYVVLTALLSLTGLDAITALSAAGSALANVGPGVGSVIGPAGNYETLSAPAKWLMGAGMLLGRLELFTVLMLLTPRFWRS